MKTYLRWLNPVVSILVFLLCICAAVSGDDGVEPAAIVAGSLPTYFAAKGLFCGTALFLLGRILLELIERRERDDAAEEPRGQQRDSPSTCNDER